MLYSQSPSYSPQCKFKSKSFILKKAKPPYFVCNMKKLGKTIDADFEVFKVRRAVCKEERTTTAGFARVKWSSNFLQGAILRRKCGKFITLVGINPQAQADTLQKRPSFDFNKNKCARS